MKLGSLTLYIMHEMGLCLFWSEIPTVLTSKIIRPHVIKHFSCSCSPEHEISTANAENYTPCFQIRRCCIFHAYKL